MRMNRPDPGGSMIRYTAKGNAVFLLLFLVASLLTYMASLL